MIKLQVVNDADLQKYATTAFCCRSSLIIVVTFTSPVQKISMMSPLCDIGGIWVTHAPSRVAASIISCSWDVQSSCAPMVATYLPNMLASNWCSVSCAEHTTSLFLLSDELPLHPWENRTIAHKLMLSSTLLTQNFKPCACYECRHGPKLWICEVQ